MEAPAPARLRLDTPIAPMAIVLVLAAIFVLARLALFGGDETRFVVAGEGLSDPARVPRGLSVLRSSTGYDGQAYYRLALDPFTREKTAHGITLDTPEYRQQRLGYPALAWLLSGGGKPSALPWALIAINVLSLGAIGFVGGALANQMGRHALWGLVFALHPGFVVSLARDLTEPLSVVFMLWGLLLLRRDRPTAASLALTAAVMTRETTALVPLGLAVAWLVAGVRRRRGSHVSPRPAREFVVPLTVLAGWQLLLYSWWKSIPFTSNRNANQPPFVGLVSDARRWIADPTGNNIHQLLDVAFIVVLLSAALWMLRSDRVLSHERWALAGAAINATLLSWSVWYDNSHFLRALTELYLLSALVVIAASRRAPRTLALASSAFTLAIAVYFVRNT